MPELSADLTKLTLDTLLGISLPILGCLLAIGVTVGIFQAATQINDPSLSFVPKMLVFGALIILLGQSFVTDMVEFFKAVLILAIGFTVL